MYEEEIARGVAVLDEHVPDWRDRVNVDVLDIGHATQCVVGQALGVTGALPTEPLSWPAALHRLGGPDPGPRGYTSSAQRSWAAAHGFDVLPYDTYTALTAAWREYLTSSTDQSQEAHR